MTECNTDDTQAPDRFVREAECRAITGLSRSTRWRLSRTGDFPKPIRVSENIVAWRLSAIQKWMEARAAASGAA